MANKKMQRGKVKVAQKPVNTGSLWLAGVGAVSLARKHGKILLGDMIGEGRRLQIEATTLVRETSADTKAHVVGMVTPLKARFMQRVGQAGTIVQTSISRGLSLLGIPTKADIDDLAQRVGALSRQLKSAK